MERFEAARGHLARIETAMREADMWESSRPAPEAFESRVAFFGDTMSFEQWLRYVMLANLETIIEERGALPESSSLAMRARREWEHFANLPPAGPVIDALAQLDAFVVLLASSTTSLRFFEAGRDVPPRDQRRYTERFASKDTRFICWELSLAHPPLGARVVHELEEHWLGPAAAGQFVQGRTETIEPDWRDAWFCHSWGFEEPGNWHPGDYRLVIRRWDEPIADGRFIIEP